MVLASILVLLFSETARGGWPHNPRLAVLLSYLVVWLPLLGAVFLASRLRGGRSLAVDFGLTFRPLDLLWGATFGVLARLVTGILEIVVYGRLGSDGASFSEPVRDLWWLFAALVAPVLIGPVIEEVFFRGLLARAVRDAAERGGGSRRAAGVTAILVSAAVFALVHVLSAATPAGMVVIGLSTFLFGLGTAALTLVTGRLGGAIVAHVTFNALVLVPALLG